MDETVVESLSIKLYEESSVCHFPLDKSGIKNRYADTSQLLYKEYSIEGSSNYLSFGTRRAEIVECHGNTPMVVRKLNNDSSIIVAQQRSVGLEGLLGFGRKRPIMPINGTLEKLEDKARDGSIRKQRWGGDRGFKRDGKLWEDDSCKEENSCANLTVGEKTNSPMMHNDRNYGKLEYVQMLDLKVKPQQSGYEFTGNIDGDKNSSKFSDASVESFRSFQFDVNKVKGFVASDDNVDLLSDKTQVNNLTVCDNVNDSDVEKHTNEKHVDPEVSLNLNGQISNSLLDKFTQRKSLSKSVIESDAINVNSTQDYDLARLELLMFGITQSNDHITIKVPGTHSDPEFNDIIQPLSPNISPISKRSSKSVDIPFEEHYPLLDQKSAEPECPMILEGLPWSDSQLELDTRRQLRKKKHPTSPDGTYRSTVSPAGTYRSTVSPDGTYRSTVSPAGTYRSTVSPDGTYRSTVSPAGSYMMHGFLTSATYDKSHMSPKINSTTPVASRPVASSKIPVSLARSSRIPVSLNSISKSTTSPVRNSKIVTSNASKVPISCEIISNYCNQTSSQSISVPCVSKTLSAAKHPSSFSVIPISSRTRSLSPTKWWEETMPCEDTFRYHTHSRHSVGRLDSHKISPSISTSSVTSKKERNYGSSNRNYVIIHPMDDAFQVPDIKSVEEIQRSENLTGGFHSLRSPTVVGKYHEQLLPTLITNCSFDSKLAHSKLDSKIVLLETSRLMESHFAPDSLNWNHSRSPVITRDFNLPPDYTGSYLYRKHAVNYSTSSSTESKVCAIM